MVWGIGLGGMAKGVDTGYGLGTKIQEDRKARQSEAEFTAALDQGQADYDAAVGSGEARAGDPNALLRYSFPRIMHPMLKSGDAKGAAAVAEWIKSDETRRGTDLFGKALTRLQAGDVRGAFGQIKELGKLKGYGPDIELDSAEELPGGRWKITGRTADGNSVTKDMTAGEIADMFSSVYNPESAFKSFRERQDKEDWKRTLLGDGSYQSRLEMSESGGRADIVNDLGYAGRYQFGAPRLADLGVYKPGKGESLSRWSKTRKDAAGKWSGTFNIPSHPEVKTLDDFLANPEAQQAVYDMHEGQNDADIASRGLNEFIGKKVKGVEITREGIQAMMHLGGAKGTERFLKTGGKYNPKDANGTSLLDYARMGSQAPVRLAAADTGTMTDGAPIDLTRPKLSNADGSFSTEQTITIQDDEGRWVNIPTIVNGQRLDEQAAVEAFKQGSNPAVGGPFATVEEAEQAARARSDEIGRVRGGSRSSEIAQGGEAGAALPGAGGETPPPAPSEGAQEVAQAAPQQGGIAERYNLSPEEVDMLEALGPEEGKKRLADIIFQQKPSMQKEFEFAKREGFEGDPFDFITAKNLAGANTLEQIRSKIARGETLSEGEQKLYDDAILRLSRMERIMLGLAPTPEAPRADEAPAPAPTPTPAPAQPQGNDAIPPAAVEMLRSDPSPEARQEFNAIFGEGAAERVLGE